MVKKYYNKMAIDSYLSTNESKKKNTTKINGKAEWKQTHGYREYFDDCQLGRGLGEMGEKGEVIKKYKLVITE